MLKTLQYAHSHLSNEKPQTAVTDWIERLSSEQFTEEDYDGIPELVDAINLQETGPTEALRALRKKLKYGNVHRQIRALTILKALTENCGHKFQTTLAHDPAFLDRLKLLAGDPMTDTKVKKKLMNVLAGWNTMFRDEKDKGGVGVLAGMWTACGGGRKAAQAAQRTAAQEAYAIAQSKREEEARERQERKSRERKEKEEEKLRKEREKAKEKEEWRRINAKRYGGSDGEGEAPPTTKAKKQKRPKFNFEEEKPKILEAVATATQASSNLVNALQHVNREQESITTNTRVQDCLTKLKTHRKQIVKYVQLIEGGDPNGEFVGTLLNTNEQILAALELYDRLKSKVPEVDSDEEEEEEERELAERGKGINLGGGGRRSSGEGRGEKDRKNTKTKKGSDRLFVPGDEETELDKLQGRQRYEVQRANSIREGRELAGGKRGSIHPDLQDLDFDGGSLPPPITPGSHSRGPTRTSYDPGLSDYSDYTSSDEEDHRRQTTNNIATTSTSARRLSTSSSLGPGGRPDSGGKAGYRHYLDDAADEGEGRVGKKALLAGDGDEDEDETGEGGLDPFADPDEGSSPMIKSRKLSYGEI